MAKLNKKINNFLSNIAFRLDFLEVTQQWQHLTLKLFKASIAIECFDSICELKLNSRNLYDKHYSFAAWQISIPFADNLSQFSFSKSVLFLFFADSFTGE